jgi:hypothetical protein
MRHTFGQAKQALARFASGFGLLDVGGTINTAMDELSRSRTWQRLRKVVRFDLAGEYFALPQDCGTLLRAAIDSKPVSIRSTEYEFLHSGPGDLDFADPDWAPIYGIQRLGVYPVMHTPDDALPLCAFSTVVPSGPLRVRGKNTDGDSIVETVPITIWTGPDSVDDIVVAGVSKTTKSFAEIDSVTVPQDATAYISLFNIDTSLTLLSRMHPKQPVPEFTRYRLPGFSSTMDATYRVLAEVSPRFVPLVDDDEVLPFDSLLPVQFMMQSLWSMEAGEVKAADEYRQRALSLLVGREETETERQTLHIVNQLYDGSAGEALDRMQNI